MSKIFYKRSDDKGRAVQIEFWKDPYTHKVVMLRKITYYEYSGETKKFRTDIPSDCTEFEEALQKEISIMKGYVKALEDIANAVNELKEQGGDSRLAYTAQLLKKNQ